MPIARLFDKNMKPLFALLAALLSSLFACQKEALVQPLPVQDGPFGDPVNGCFWLPCEQAIAETKLAWQPLANLYNDTLWVDILCCQDGTEAFALVIVAPQKKADSHQAATRHFRD